MLAEPSTMYKLTVVLNCVFRAGKGGTLNDFSIDSSLFISFYLIESVLCFVKCLNAEVAKFRSSTCSTFYCSLMSYHGTMAVMTKHSNLQWAVAQWDGSLGKPSPLRRILRLTKDD